MDTLLYMDSTALKQVGNDRNTISRQNVNNSRIFLGFSLFSEIIRIGQSNKSTGYPKIPYNLIGDFGIACRKRKTPVQPIGCTGVFARVVVFVLVYVVAENQKGYFIVSPIFTMPCGNQKRVRSTLTVFKIKSAVVIGVDNDGIPANRFLRDKDAVVFVVYHTAPTGMQPRQHLTHKKAPAPGSGRELFTDLQKL